MPQQSYAEAMIAGAALADHLAPLSPLSEGTFLNHYDGGASPLNGLRVLTAAEIATLVQPALQLIIQPPAPERPTEGPTERKVYQMGNRRPLAA